MTETPGAGTSRTSFFGEVKDAVTLRAGLLVVGVVALQLLFIASYVGALHNPKPRDVSFGVVAPQVTAEQTVARLKQLPGSPLDPRAVSDAATARRQILNRDIDGALVIDPRGTKDTLLVATGGGTVLATTLETITATLERTEQRTVRTVDVAPASSRTSTGCRRSTWSSAGASAAICAPRSWRSAPAPGPPTRAAR